MGFLSRNVYDTPEQECSRLYAIASFNLDILSFYSSFDIHSTQPREVGLPFLSNQWKCVANKISSLTISVISINGAAYECYARDNNACSNQVWTALHMQQSSNCGLTKLKNFSKLSIYFTCLSWLKNCLVSILIIPKAVSCNKLWECLNVKWSLWFVEEIEICGGATYKCFQR